MSTIRELITGSLRLINVIQANETPTNEDMDISFKALNQMLENWSNEKLTIFSMNPYLFEFTPYKKSYTLGPGGDWDIVRPMEILAGYVAYDPNYTPAPPAGDPYWNNVSLLLPLNGTVGSTLVQDFSQYAQNKTIAQDFSYSTNNPKFGSSSLEATTTDCEIPNYTGNQFNRQVGEAFTIEFFVRWENSSYNSTATPAYLEYYDNNFPSQGIVVAKYTNTNNELIFRFDSTLHYLPMNNGAWNHIAIVLEDNDDYTVYINGIASATGNYPVAIADSQFRIGSVAGGGAYPCESYIDEFRVTQGIARYTSNFTPPTEAFPIGPVTPAPINPSGNGTFPIDIPMEKLTYGQYGAIAVKNTSSVFPLKYYDDQNYPLRNVTFWPIPTKLQPVRLWLWQPLIDPQSIDDTVNFPKGYERALRFALAVEIAAEFGKEVPDQVRSIANNSKALIKRINSTPQIMRGDVAIASQKPSLFNYITGDTIPTNM